MTDVTVTAIGDFSYRGRAIHAGRVLVMAPVDAMLFARQRLVSLSRHPGLNRASLQPDPDPPDPSPTRRRYRRRDLVADDS